LFFAVRTWRNEEVDRITGLISRTIKAVEEKLWFEKDSCYIDIQQEEEDIGGPYRTLTQDVCLYLIAITENEDKNNNPARNNNDILHNKESRIYQSYWHS
jgi:hypothetical protein